MRITGIDCHVLLVPDLKEDATSSAQVSTCTRAHAHARAFTFLALEITAESARRVQSKQTRHFCASKYSTLLPPAHARTPCLEATSLRYLFHFFSLPSNSNSPLLPKYIVRQSARQIARMMTPLRCLWPPHTVALFLQDNLVVFIRTDVEGLFGVGESDANPWMLKAAIEAPSTHTMGMGLKDMLIGKSASP